MSKIVMPKNSAVLDEIKASMRVYFEENDWLTNDVYTPRLKNLIGSNQDPSAYTKKAQIPAYFGFLKWQDISNNRSPRCLTELGKKFYSHWKDNDSNGMLDDIMTSLETTVFGRNNYGCPDSDSDIEPPILIIRGIVDLGYMTKSEMIALLWYLEDSKGNYTDTIKKIRLSRGKFDSTLVDGAPNYYSDNKPITMLIRWNFLQESASDPSHIIINPKVKEKYGNRLSKLQIYNVDKSSDCSNPFERINDSIDDTHQTLKCGQNIILYGVPGCGKSHKIKTEYCDKEQFMERVVFHPDYTYSDFIGQILPENDNGRISYPFIPGPFTKILAKAENDPNNNYYLIIEELNRGNAPAIFGEVFQLLDRIDGVSEYGINNADIALKVYGDPNHQVRLSKNLYILATMNTADQNVFTLDTAFKRRWKMRSIMNDIDGCFFGGKPICNSDVSWHSFLKTINDKIIDLGQGNVSSEDKRLGAYFVQPNELSDIDVFSEKVLMYLWNDAFKFEHEDIFNPKYKTLEQLIDGFKSILFDVFAPNIQFERMNGGSMVDSTDQTNG